MLTKKDKILLTEQLDSLESSLHSSSPNFNNTKVIVGRLEHLLNDAKGIPKAVNNALSIELQNLRIALSERNVDKALDIFDNLIITLGASLNIKPTYIRER